MTKHYTLQEEFYELRSIVASDRDSGQRRLQGLPLTIYHRMGSLVISLCGPEIDDYPGSHKLEDLAASLGRPASYRDTLRWSRRFYNFCLAIGQPPEALADAFTWSHIRQLLVMPDMASAALLFALCWRDRPSASEFQVEVRKAVAALKRSGGHGYYPHSVAFCRATATGRRPKAPKDVQEAAIRLNSAATSWLRLYDSCSVLFSPNDELHLAEIERRLADAVRRLTHIVAISPEEYAAEIATENARDSAEAATRRASQAEDDTEEYEEYEFEECEEIVEDVENEEDG